MRRGSYASNRVAEMLSASIPVITLDVEAATIYELTWQRQDGTAVRVFDVLALDEQMAEEMGGLRLAEKHDQDILDWRLMRNVSLSDPPRSRILAVLSFEDPDEQQLRQETFKARRAA